MNRRDLLKSAAAGAGLTILPAVHNTDGYFVGQLQRRR